MESVSPSLPGLPNALLISVLGRLDVVDLLATIQTCRRLHALVEEDGAVGARAAVCLARRSCMNGARTPAGRYTRSSCIHILDC